MPMATKGVFLGLIFFLACLCPPEVSAVPAAPNEAVVTGTVAEYCIASPDTRERKQQGPGFYKLVISVETVKDVETMPNFLKGKEGQTVTCWSKRELSPELFGKKVKAHLVYRGDERGGMFWIKSVEPLP